MARPRKTRPRDVTAPSDVVVDLYDYARPSASRPGRKPSPDRPAPDEPSSWTVTDDWPAHVPITEAEIEVFEAWFGDLFDELFSTRH
jgi:hypothetical protein